MATKKILLTQDKFALVDACDYTWLSEFKWTAARTVRGRFYAVRAGSLRGDRPRERILMAREILGLRKGNPLQADHLNFDTLDNRRKNLRAVTSIANKRRVPSRGGSSRYVGVTWDSQRQLWRAQIQVDGVMKNLGRYCSERAAAQARDSFVRERQTGSLLNFGEQRVEVGY